MLGALTPPAPPPRPPPPPPAPKFLEAWQVNELSYRRVVPWLKAAGLPAYRGNTEDRRARLRAYFAEKQKDEPGFKLKLP